MSAADDERPEERAEDAAAAGPPETPEPEAPESEAAQSEVPEAKAPTRKRVRKPSRRKAAREQAPAAQEQAETPEAETPEAEAPEAEAPEADGQAAEEPVEEPAKRRARKPSRGEPSAAPAGEAAAGERAHPGVRGLRRGKAPAKARRRRVVRAHARYVRTSARKARMVSGHLPGKTVEQARAILAFTPREAARDWSKLLESAVANAESNHELLEDDLIVREAYADEGPTIKRFRPRAMGRATPIAKRTSHLTIGLIVRPEPTTTNPQRKKD